MTKNCNGYYVDVEIKGRPITATYAAVFFKRARMYDSCVKLGREGDFVLSDDLMGVISLGLKTGDRVRIRANGIDAQDCLADLVALFKESFD